ncbi:MULTISPECIES: hypothetical protein [unclassified Sinorhizobium]|uniref:hypothetical protein n=1 Tax=unclassified Sinorhizobium TaxID=2613772 RepID=UPI0024C452B8|nr:MULTISPECIES: hypothetical protein [unclassified Sinorhizobium]MDK1376533.1 hypothetical protein [Sinorhizobium sp. 6-70]MDK1481502.1 hypothetical protein [Sinorhizobium sp. 6-117]
MPAEAIGGIPHTGSVRNDDHRYEPRDKALRYRLGREGNGWHGTEPLIVMAHDDAAGKPVFARA